MCKPYNGKMKEFKWRQGIFQRRLNQFKMISQVCGVVRDERFYRTIKRLVLFADMESFNIQPPCHWNYSLAPDDCKIGLMNTECPCGINTDEIHYMDMNELEFNGKGEIIFTTDHDTDFGFGAFYEIEMWTYREENQILQLVDEMKKSNNNQQQLIKAQIVKFIGDTMAAYEDEVLAFEFSKIVEAGIEAHIAEMILKESKPRQNTRKIYREQKPSAPKISKPKKVLTSRQKRLQADAIQAAKDAEEAKLKQLEKKKNESKDANGKKKKKKAKTHFRKSQKPARL